MPHKWRMSDKNQKIQDMGFMNEYGQKTILYKCGRGKFEVRKSNGFVLALDNCHYLLLTIGTTR